jgi:hypothetical protein
MSLTELALLDGKRPLPSGDAIGLKFNLILRENIQFAVTEEINNQHMYGL